MDREKWGGLVWLTFGIVICVGAFRLSLGTFRDPGPGFLPFITGAILAVLSFILLFQCWRTEKSKQESPPFFMDKKKVWKVALTLIALLFYSIGMDYLGFLVSTTIFLAFLFLAVDPQRWYIVIFGSIGVSVISYVVFEILLQSPLPKGIF